MKKSRKVIVISYLVMQGWYFVVKRSKVERTESSI